MIYLLGGPPRVGKSILSNQIRQRYALSVVSTDALGAVLENVLTPETAPDLFVLDRFNQMPMAERVKLIRDEPGVFIDYVRRESHVVWTAAAAFIRREHDEGKDVLIEGAAVLPELVSQLDNISYRVVFIGNQGENHGENIKESAKKHQHDWMQDVSDEYIFAFGLLVNQMSTILEQAAERYGFEYIEMDQKSFVEVSDAILKSFGLNDSEPRFK